MTRLIELIEKLERELFEKEARIHELETKEEAQ